MHPDLEKLTQLQEADAAIRRLNEEIAALPKRVAAIEAKLADSKARVEKARAAIKQADAARRKAEGEIQGLQQKVSKYREQSLEVKTNEQYRALMHEIEFAEQEVRRAEDKVLEAMLETEANEKQVKACEAELKAEAAEIEKEKTEARARTEQDQKELVDWNAKRELLRASVPENLLRHYDRVLGLRGSGIAEAREGKCMACRVMLRPQMWNEVRSEKEIVSCDSCQRLLFYDPANEPVVEAPKASARGSKRPKPDEKAWYYVSDAAGDYFAAVANRIRGSWMRKYAPDTGALLGSPVYRDQPFQTAFSQELENGIWIFDELEGQDLENWEQLPPEVLDILKRELRIIQLATEQAPAT